MYAKHGNLVDADASGAKASTKVVNFEGNVRHLRFREPHCHSAPPSREPLRIFAQTLYFYNLGI